MVRSISTQDIPKICQIYNHYIKNTCITFETDIISKGEMEKRVEVVVSKIPLLVYVENDIVQGYAYATQWKARTAYKYSAESSIYLADEANVALHEKLGFKKVAHFKEVGFKHSPWVDVGYWQLRFGS